MKITKIDESAYLPESAINRLKKLGEFRKHDDRPSREEAISRLSDTDLAIVEWTNVDRSMIQKIRETSDRLKYIVIALTGYEFVDVQAAKEYGILASNIPNYSKQSVAEHAFAMLLALIRNIKAADAAAREGKRDYFEHFMSTELYGKTLGILGLGSIGSWISHIGLGFGMKVIAHSRKPKDLPNVRDVSLEDLLMGSDVFVVSVDYNQTTANLLTKERLGLLKPDSYFVSITPSGIYDEDALADMVQRNKLAGVALDIPKEHSPLEKIDKTILTPCTAWYTQASLDRLATIMVDNVEQYILGKPQNLVN